MKRRQTMPYVHPLDPMLHPAPQAVTQRAGRSTSCGLPSQAPQAAARALLGRIWGVSTALGSGWGESTA